MSMARQMFQKGLKEQSKIQKSLAVSPKSIVAAETLTGINITWVGGLTDIRTFCT